MKRKYVIILLLFIILLIGLYLFLSRWKQSSNSDLTQPIKKGNIVLSVYGIGTVTANRSYQLKVGVIGTLLQLFIKEGDYVERGRRLAKIDNQIYTAPFSGTITNLLPMVGENVFPQIPVLTLVDLKDRYILVNLEQQGMLRVRPHQKVKISFDSLRSESIEGEVTSVYSFNSQFLARISAPHLSDQILPGMTADIAIVIEEHKDVLIIPVSALEVGQVYVKDKYGLPRAIQVKVGIVDRAMAEIVSGDIKEGDRLLIRKKLGL